MPILLPNPPKKGDSLSADWGAAIVRALRACRVFPGDGIAVSQGPNGTTIHCKAANLIQEDCSYPFKISFKNSLTVQIAPGTINNSLPEGMEDGPALVAVTGTADICLKCTFDETGSLTVASFTTTYSDPTDTDLCIRIGHVTVQEGAITHIYNYVQNSLGVACCPDPTHADYWEIGGSPTSE